MTAQRAILGVLTTVVANHNIFVEVDLKITFWNNCRLVVRFLADLRSFFEGKNYMWPVLSVYGLSQLRISG